MSRKIDETTVPSLLVRLRDHNDTTAWSGFVEVYSPLIYEFCRMRGLQASDAADVTQEVLLRVAKAIQSFEYDARRGLFRDWLARIVLNEIRRFVAKPHDVPTAAGAFEQDSGGLEATWNENFQQHMFQTALERCKSHFSEQTWKLFDHSWLQKQPAEQVACERGVRIDQVYVARSRVLKRLRVEVAALADEGW